MRGYDRFLVVLGLIGLVVLVLPIILIFLAISVIGIPAAFVLAFMPGLAIVLIAARVAERRVLDAQFPQWAGAANRLGAIGMVVGLLGAFAAVDNVRQRDAIEGLVAGDLQALGLPLPKGMIAVRRAGGVLSCDDLCRRLLLTGSATTVLVQKLDDPLAALDPQSVAVSFRMEAGATCGEPNLGRDDRLEIAGEQPTDQVALRPQPSSVLMRAQVSQGNCLMESAAKLGDADVVITNVRLSQKPPGNKVGFRSGTALITADRLSVHQKEAGMLRETYRWTGVIAGRMWPLALPVPTTGYGFEIGIGFGRSETYQNIPSKYNERPDWPGFLTGTLGLALAMPAQTEEGPQVREVIAAALDRDGALTPTEQALIDGYLDTVGTRIILGGQDNPETSAPQDRALYLRIVQDPRVTLTYATARATPPPDLFSDAELTALAQAAFARIKAGGQQGTDPIRYAGDILSRLPKDTLAPFLPDLMALSSNRDLRWPSLDLMTRFADFGDVGAERLLFLVGDSMHFGTNRDGNPTLHPYLAGLIGLCRMGQAASTQGPGLLAMVRDGRVTVSDGSSGRLAVVTLIRVGVAEAEVRAVAGAAKDPFPAARIDREIGRADDEHICYY